jgi:serine/threonine protein kinase
MAWTGVDQIRTEPGRASRDPSLARVVDGLGEYRLGRRFDDGGTNEVYEATGPGTTRKVVVKFLQRAVAAGAQASQACRYEQALVGSLQHPNIALLVALGTTSAGVPYLVREHLEGETLEAYLARRAPLDPHQAVGLIRSVATALASAHAAGVVHGELRPNKIFLTEVLGCPGRFVKLVDFGLWRLTGDRRGPGAQAETARLMAPELVAGDPVDHRADQFSLAAIAYRMLARVDAFPGDDVAAVLRSVQHEPPAAIPEVARRDPALGNVLRKALAKDPNERFESILQFAAALEHAVTRAVFHAADGWAVETTDIVRLKTDHDLPISPVGPADPMPDDPWWSDRNTTPAREPLASQKRIGTTMEFPPLETGADARAWEPEIPPPRRGQMRQAPSRPWPRLLFAAAFLSAGAGLAWWTGQVPLPDLQPSSLWQTVVSLSGR